MTEALEFDEHKMDRVIQFLTQGHLESEGGYPYDYLEEGDVFYVAELDDGKERQATLIKTYSHKYLIDWYDRAHCYLSENNLSHKWSSCDGGDFGDWSEAFHSTRTESSK